MSSPVTVTRWLRLARRREGQRHNATLRVRERGGESGGGSAAASTWTNIGTKLNSCATSLDTVCSSRLAGQESLAVATFKTLQAGSASHLRDDVGTASARMDSQRPVRARPRERMISPRALSTESNAS